MFNEDKKVIPYRIKQARISRGYSMPELSEMIGVTKQAIFQYEMGKYEPSKAVLNQISNVLNYPINFFYKPMPSNDTANSVVFFRSKKTTTVKTLNAAKEKISIFREINDYLSQYIDFPAVNLPKTDYSDDNIEPIDNEEIEEYAMNLRNYWGLGTGPINNLMNVIQKNGIMVSKMQLGLKKIDAFSVWYNNIPFVYLSNDKDTNTRIRFDIAHELGHLIMHSDYFSEDDLDKTLVFNKLEDEANRFAGAFLLPKDTFSKDVYSTSIDHFIQLKSKWKASISCMIRRCETLGILSANQLKYLKDQMTTRVYWRKEPLDKEMPIEKPFAYKQAVKLLIENNIITPYDFIENIGCNADELEQYCFLEKGTLATKESTNVIKLRNIIK